MPTIQEEYARLLAVAKTKSGFKKLDEEWMIASSYKKNDNGDWIKIDDSAGGMVAGFAIDFKTLQVIVHPRGRDHLAPYWELVTLIQKQEGLSDEEYMRSGMGNEEWLEKRHAIEHRVIRGWAAYAEGWAFPLLTINGALFFDDEKIQQMESSLLEKQIGLPLVSIFKKKM